MNDIEEDVAKVVKHSYLIFFIISDLGFFAKITINLMLRNHDLLKTTFYYFFLPLLLIFFYNERKKYCVRHREKSNLNYFVPTFRSSHLQRPRQRKQNYGAGIKKKLKLKFLKKNLDRKLFKN